MRKKKSYIFTNKKKSHRALMGVILGVISLVSLSMAVFLSYRVDGAFEVRFGFVGALCTIYSVTGLLLGIVTAFEKDYFRLFSVLGILFNLLALSAVGLILYLGASG